jgi:hypothetical protein
MRSHPALAVALLCAASMTVAACGSSVAAGPQSPKIDPAFVAKVNAFCAAEARRVPTYGKQFPYPISIQTTPTWRLSPKSAATSQPGCRNGISSPPALPPRRASDRPPAVGPDPRPRVAGERRRDPPGERCPRVPGPSFHRDSTCHHQDRRRAAQRRAQRRLQHHLAVRPAVLSAHTSRAARCAG